MTASTVQSTMEWAHQHGDEIRFKVQLDDHNPPRIFAQLVAFRYDSGVVQGGLILVHEGELRDPSRCTFLIDTGDRVTPYYPAFWMEGENWVGLHPFPTGDRTDRWFIGPRRSYHLKEVSS